MFSQINRSLLLFLSVVLLTTAISACSAQSNADDLNMMPLDQMPVQVQLAPVLVQQAYQFASANPEILQQIPCYCGCRAMGHTSNYSCYVQGVDANGVITFDNHALGCVTCVNITQDVMRLLRKGKSLQDIQTYIDNTYGRYDLYH